jgi:hypothetical protein
MYAEGRHVGKSEQCITAFFGEIIDSDAWNRDSAVARPRVGGTCLALDLYGYIIFLDEARGEWYGLGILSIANQNKGTSWPEN